MRDVLHHSGPSGPSAESPGISENSPSCGHFDADHERTWYIGDLQCNNIQDWNGILHILKEKHIQYILNWVLASSYWLFSVRSGRLALCRADRIFLRLLSVHRSSGRPGLDCSTSDDNPNLLVFLTGVVKNSTTFGCICFGLLSYCHLKESNLMDWLCAWACVKRQVERALSNPSGRANERN